MKTLMTACVAAFFLYAAGSAAQVIFKQTDEYGRTIFTDHPDPAARTVARYTPAQYTVSSTQPDNPVVSVAAASDTRTDVEIALQNMAPISSWRAASVDSNEAGRRMRREQRTHSNGAQARPAEPTVNSAAVSQIRARLTADRPSQRLPNIPRLSTLALAYILLTLAFAFLAFNTLRFIGSLSWPSMPSVSLQ